MSQQKKKVVKPFVKVGEQITVRLGSGRPLRGKVVEDYGPLAADGAHIFRIQIRPDFVLTLTGTQIGALKRKRKATKTARPQIKKNLENRTASA
jgi:hypothetical protein